MHPFVYLNLSKTAWVYFSLEKGMDQSSRLPSVSFFKDRSPLVLNLRCGKSREANRRRWWRSVSFPIYEARGPELRGSRSRHLCWYLLSMNLEFIHSLIPLIIQQHLQSNCRAPIFSYFPFVNCPGTLPFILCENKSFPFTSPSSTVFSGPCRCLNPLQDLASHGGHTPLQWCPAVLWSLTHRKRQTL